MVKLFTISVLEPVKSQCMLCRYTVVKKCRTLEFVITNSEGCFCASLIHLLST